MVDWQARQDGLAFTCGLHTARGLISSVYRVSYEGPLIKAQKTRQAMNVYSVKLLFCQSVSTVCD